MSKGFYVPMSRAMVDDMTSFGDALTEALKRDLESRQEAEALRLSDPDEYDRRIAASVRIAQESLQKFIETVRQEIVESATVEVPEVVLSALMEVYEADQEGLADPHAYRVISEWEQSA